MLQQYIFLNEVLQTMSTLDAQGFAVPFSVSFRTLNRNSKTGGKLVKYPQAKLVIKEENKNIDSIQSLRTVSTRKTTIKRNPNHWDNKTRNIKILPQGNIRKIHINHIIEFNNQKVVY